MRIFYILLTLFTLASCESLPSWLGGAEKEIKRLPGDRVNALDIDSDIQADQTLANIEFTIPASFNNDYWLQGNGLFSAEKGNLKLADNLSATDKAEIGNGINFLQNFAPKPVVSDGKIYAMDGAGNISAHDINQINHKYWLSEILANDDEDEIISGGLSIDKQMLYAISGSGKIAAIDTSNGKVIWNRNLGVPLRSAPHVAVGKIFVISLDSQIFALDIASGETIWTHRGINETSGIIGNASPVAISDFLLVPYASGELYALKSDSGEELWRASLAQTRRTEATAIFSSIEADPLVDESVVFAVSNGGMFSAINILTGQALWNKKIAATNTAWLAGDYIFALSEDNTLFAMVKYDGRVRWAIKLPRYKDEKRNLYPIIWRGPIMAGGNLVIASDNGEMRIINAANGTEISKIEIAEKISTAPIIADGKIFLIGKDATIYSYK